MDDFVERILYDDTPFLCEEPYHILESEMDKYLRAIEILNDLKSEGILEFTADNYKKPFVLHSIQVKFNFDADDFAQMETERVAELLSQMDSLLIDKESQDWQISAKLYEED